MAEKEQEFENVTKYLEWKVEIESEDYYWLKGYFRGHPVVIITATGVHPLQYIGRDAKIMTSNEFGFQVLLEKF